MGASPRYLLVGGLIAVDFDPTEAYLLTVSHSGHGVFATCNWKRVARDYHLAHPQNGRAIGIGPIEGQAVAVAVLDSEHPIIVRSPSGRITLRCESSGIEAAMAGTPPNCARDPSGE